MFSLNGLFNPFKPVIYIEKRNQIIKRMDLELQKNFHISLFYIEIMNLSEMETKFGELACLKINRMLEKILPNICHEVFKGSMKLVAIDKPWVHNYAIYMSSKENLNHDQFDRISIKLKVLLENGMSKICERTPFQCIKFHLGYAPIKRNNVSRDLYKSIQLASRMAKHNLFSQEFKYIRQFHEILDNEEVHTLYQPIVSLQTGQCFGWEALARGPENSYFYSPVNLFHYADELDQSIRLETMCRRKALAKLMRLEPKNKLFLNLDPRSLDDSYLLNGKAFDQVLQNQLSPHNVVLEITEHHAITNYKSFQRTINQYRKMGYLIAVDDAGAGYSSLEAITAICPDFIKMDMSLIRNIDIDPVKQALLETFVNFAAKVKSKIIAEGIETESELEKLIALGVDYGQGFFLGKPEKELRNMNSEVRTILETHIYQKEFSRKLKSEGKTRVLDIIGKTFTIGMEEKVKTVHEIFESNKKIDSIVIIENQKPMGLIMRLQFYNALSSQYGIPLYFEKSISNLMNFSPLIVEVDDLVEEVVKRAMERETAYLYDAVIVTDKEEYVGVVTLRMLLESLIKSKPGTARSSNKVTLFPKNAALKSDFHLSIQ